MVLLLPSSLYAWQVISRGTERARGFHDEARAVAVDARGDVVSAGFVRRADGRARMRVAKYVGPTGEALWTHTATDWPDSEARALSLGAGGDPVVAGVAGRNFSVARLSASDGSTRWRTTLTEDILGKQLTGGDARAVVLDANDDVIAAGVIRVSARATRFFTVAKLAGIDGHEVWRRESPFSGAEDFGVARAVAVDGEGNVFGAGCAPGDLVDFSVSKVSPVGGALWVRQRHGTASLQQARAFVRRPFFVPEEPPLIAGVLGDDALGDERCANVADAMVLDRDGNVVAAGRTLDDGYSAEFTVVKIASSGSTLWHRETDGGARRSDRALAVQVDPAGDVVAAGYLHAPGARRPAFSVLKLDGRTGFERWRYTLGGSSRRADRVGDKALAVAVDGSGDVIAAGVIENARTSFDLAVVKLAGADGGEIWRRVFENGSSREPYTADHAMAVTTDDGGDVLVAGSLGGDFFVARLSGASGADVAPGPAR